MTEVRTWHRYLPPGVPATLDIPLWRVPDVLTASANQYSKRTAILFQHESITYQELKHTVDLLTASLQKHGMKRGDKAALLFENCPDFILCYFAVLQAGGVVVQINPLYTERELSTILQDSESTWIFLQRNSYEKVKNIQHQTALKSVFLSDQGNVFSASHTQEYREEESQFLNEYSLVDQIRFFTEDNPFTQVSEATKSEWDDPREELAVLQYTGGTTGRSKGVMLTHYNLVSNIIQSHAASSTVLEWGQEISLTVSPLYHVYGMTSGMNIPIYMGATILLLPRFDKEEVMDWIQKYRPTLFPGVPAMYMALLHHPRAKEVDLTCLKICNCGSAPMPVEILKQFEEVTNARIVEGYGLSEASPVTHRNPIVGLCKPGSIGIPLPSTDQKIVDVETGLRELPSGQTGELLILGPQVMKGYWKNEAETAHALREGWLYTGDLAQIDEDGYCYIVGRKKDMIITSGFNVYPKEVEEILYEHPSIREAVVFGIPDAYRSEVVTAVVVLKEPNTLSAEELLHYCRERLTPYKIPRHIHFREELPKTSVGKILRRTLVEQFS